MIQRMLDLLHFNLMVSLFQGTRESMVYRSIVLVSTFIASSALLVITAAQPVDINYLNSITHKQLANRYKVPQFDIGMPR